MESEYLGLVGQLQKLQTCELQLQQLMVRCLFVTVILCCVTVVLRSYRHVRFATIAK